MSDNDHLSDHYEQDSDYYMEWHVDDESLKGRGTVPLFGIDHSGLSEWESECRRVITDGIDLSEHEGEVVFKTWAFRDKTGIYWESLVGGINDPEMPG